MSIRAEIQAKTTEELRAMIPRGAVGSYERELAIREIQRRDDRPHGKRELGESSVTMGLLRGQADYIEQTFGISIPMDDDADNSKEVTDQEVNEMYYRAREAEPEADDPGQ